MKDFTVFFLEHVLAGKSTVTIREKVYRAYVKFHNTSFLLERGLGGNF